MRSLLRGTVGGRYALGESGWRRQGCFDTYSAKNDQIGQAAMKAIVPIIKFFPANPADWTTSPLAN